MQPALGRQRRAGVPDWAVGPPVAVELVRDWAVGRRRPPTRPCGTRGLGRRGRHSLLGEGQPEEPTVVAGIDLSASAAQQLISALRAAGVSC
eukprot:11223875-Lingulodinium_polyedra.AAC.1